MSSVKFIIRKGRRYYFEEWRGHEKVCPAFGEKVFVTGLGWRHIAKHPRRTLIDKIIRVKKLPLAREVLETSTTYQTFQKRGDYFYYGFTAIKGDTRIKVVVTSKGKESRKILYSVMFKNIKRAEQKTIDRHNARMIKEFRQKYPRRESIKAKRRR